MGAARQISTWTAVKTYHKWINIKPILVVKVTLHFYLSSKYSTNTQKVNNYVVLLDNE